MRIFRYLIGLLIVATAAEQNVLQADVKLPAIIGDKMVLQQDQPIPVWGTADPGEKITVTLGEQTASTTAESDGRWMIRLPAIEKAGPVDFQVAGKNEITLTDVLVGEVWVCSGQSNMEWPVNRSNNAEEEIAAAKFPKIRLFQAKKVISGEPLADTEGRWVECSPESVPGFSAVGYFFGRDIHRQTGGPVGLIQTAWGGTPAEAWTSAPMLKSDPAFRPIVDRWANILANADEIQKKHQTALAEWRQAAREAREAGRRPPRRPRPPLGPNHHHRASGLYNGMIAPLLPYAIRGAIWYQGESNASRAYQYRKLFPAMIRDWRKNWNQGDFPFLFVQLANFRQTADAPGESDWAELREAQSMTLKLPNTAMAVTIDIGEADDIHPRNKQDVGSRLALAARAIAYGEKIVSSGPQFRSMTIEGDRIRLHFNHVGGGLEARGGSLKGFAIAGKDRKFVWAEARIDGDTVVVHADEVQEPLAVRYAWADNPVCNLSNQEGLPASPFRTDTWPGITVNNQ